MRNINIIFEDKEYKEIEQQKKISKLSWHDFIIDIIKKNKINSDEK